MGLDSFHVWAGPCAIESEEQFLKTAQFVQSQGCSGLRAGMFKLRTSAKNFQGLGPKSLPFVRKAKFQNTAFNCG